ncbi:MAG: hypothetical protein AB7F35_01050 [Acetobacteraceae bacterium]
MHRMLNEPTVNAIDRLTAAKDGRKTDDLTPASRARKLLAALNELYDDADPAASLTDLLVDARHFADAHGLKFAAADRIAQHHYRLEIADGCAGKEDAS